MKDGTHYIEGDLKKTESGWELERLELEDGSPIEVLSDQGWMVGRVEYTGEVYVFLNPLTDCYAPLAEGLKARIRVVLH